ncbi:MAG TPA: RDD family protein [Candidatus Acidoferrales bacterium]|nr:RDD family protein [Candidatus Acidoferrales bacterium]
MFCQACGANVADGTAFCTSCGRPIVGLAVGQSGGAAAIAVAPPVAIAGTAATFAGFWLRLVAAILDFVVLLVPTIPIGILMFASMLPEIGLARGNPGLLIATLLPRIIFFGLLLLTIKWLYWAVMESSTWQATLGKKALGLYVTDLAGNRASFGKTSGRFWSGRGISIVPTLGALYYFIDCVCCGFTEKKQAVHDMIAGCLVMRKV